MRYRRFVATLTAVALLFLFVFTAECEAKLKILTTHTVLKSLAEEVGGAHVSVTSLATGREDPHAITAKPSYMVDARKADLFIKLGMEMEIGYEQLVIDGSRNPAIRFEQPGYLDASLEALRLEVPQIRIDRSMGDVHPLGNPHYWLDPYNARRIAKSIANKLEELDPAHSADYQARYADFEKRLDSAMFGEALVNRVGGDRLWSLELAGQLDGFLQKEGWEESADGWRRQMKSLASAKIITYHRSWIYFANRFGLVIVGELEPKPGIPPSPGHLRQIIRTAQNGGAALILMEPYYDRGAADFVAEKTGLPVIKAANAVGGQTEVDDYFSLIDNVVKKLNEGRAGLATAGRSGHQAQ